jgi:hypothetical protein
VRERRPDYTWTTEYDVAGTPVDLGGVDGTSLALCELEWRRADPADNTAKVFRHLASDALDAFETVRVVQVFTRYYDLASGGYSSKRLNAEFVGRRIAASFDHVEYHPLTVALDPPKRGGSLPATWTTAVESTADTFCTAVGD